MRHDLKCRCVECEAPLMAALLVCLWIALALASGALAIVAGYC